MSREEDEAKQLEEDEDGMVSQEAHEGRPEKDKQQTSAAEELLQFPAFWSTETCSFI